MSEIEFNYYTPEDLKRTPTGRTTLTISKAGMFGISHNMALATGVKNGDRVLLVQNKNAPKDWFFTYDDNGFEVRLKSAKENSIGFTSIDLMRVFYKSLELDFETRYFIISKEPIDVKGKSYFPIITSSATNKNYTKK